MNGFKEKLISKLKVTLIHLVLSLLVFIVILYFIFFDWYPEPFFTAQGGWQGVRLMAFVDLVLGPSLTFIVFNQFKKRKEIIFDLSLIAVVQITALIWGGYQVYSQRPIALVFWAGNFYTVTSAEYREQGIENPDFSQFSQSTPPLIYSRVPKMRIEIEKSRRLTEKQIPIYAQVSLYETIDGNLKSIFANKVDIEEIMSNNSEMKYQLEQVTHGNIEKYRYIGLKAKYQNMILVLDENGKLVGEVKAPYLE